MKSFDYNYVYKRIPMESDSVDFIDFSRL